MVLWDINHMMPFDELTQEEEFPSETLVVQTRSKGPVTQNHPIIAQAPKKPDNSTPLAKPTPILNSAPKFPTQEVSKLEYNVVEDFKKMKENIYVMDLCRIPQQKEYLLLQALKGRI
jgi:hypothetical protein